MRGNMNKYIKREDAIFAACKILDKFGGCKMGALCPDVGCSEVRKIIDTFPMIEIPNQYGRLIDANVFEKANAYFWDREFINPKYSDTLADLVNAAPTVIPAKPPRGVY